MVCVLAKGRPYDTMEEVIGLRGTPGHGSMREWGIRYRELPLTEHGGVDWNGLPAALHSGENIQGSHGPQMLCHMPSIRKCCVPSRHLLLVAFPGSVSNQHLILSSCLSNRHW